MLIPDSRMGLALVDGDDVPRARIDPEAVRCAVGDLRTALGADIGADGLRETPRRVADAYVELLTPPAFRPTRFPNDDGCDGLIVARAIPFHSLCTHHLLPFRGVAHVGYLPGERIIGLRKLARVVELFSRDLQIQERLTVQIADWLQAELRPAGIGVVLEAEHMCMSVPGVQPPGARTVASALDGVLYLRTLQDSDALRERLERGGSVVVVGAGWIGSEVPASARQRALDVTVVAPGSVPLERVLGPEVGGIYRAIHREHGVRMALGSRVEAFEGDDVVERVRTSDGHQLECDFVVVGIGARPRTELAAWGRLSTGDGIFTDEYLQTSALGVFAAGDVACAHHPFYGRRIRVEHWANALRQGPAAARNMLGAQDPYDRLPYFFSDQYDIGMEYSGFAHTWDRVLFRGDPTSREFIAFWMTGDRVVAGMNVNVWDVADPIQRLIRDGVTVDDRRLVDPCVPLEHLAPSERKRPA